MIVYASVASSTAVPVAAAVAQHSVSGRTFSAQAITGTPFAEAILKGEAGDSAELQPTRQDVVEQFDWSNARIGREFIRLEQKVLARKASQDEEKRYQSMKRDRNGRIFADRYVRDYAEIQRLRKLAQKLAEIQQFLKPLTI